MASLHGFSLGTALAGALALGACFSPPSSETDGGSSSGSSDGGANVCIPGETQNCLCLGGQDGVQACNENGSGFETCECPDDGSTGSSTPATTEPGDSSGGDTTAGAEGTDTGTSSGGEGDSSGGTLPPHEGPYGHCVDGMCNLPDEGCASTMDPDTTICITPGCRTSADCPPVEGMVGGGVLCVDITGEGEGDCFLGCGGDGDCFPGAVCFGIGDGMDGICVWPTPT